MIMNHKFKQTLYQNAYKIQANTFYQIHDPQKQESTRLKRPQIREKMIPKEYKQKLCTKHATKAHSTCPVCLDLRMQFIYNNQNIFISDKKNATET